MYLADFPLLDSNLMEKLQSDPETSNKFFGQTTLVGHLAVSGHRGPYRYRTGTSKPWPLIS